MYIFLYTLLIGYDLWGRTQGLGHANNIIVRFFTKISLNPKIILKNLKKLFKDLKCEKRLFKDFSHIFPEYKGYYGLQKSYKSKISFLRMFKIP